MKVAVDAMGGDFAPHEIILGAIEALDLVPCDIVLVGDQELIQAELDKDRSWLHAKPAGGELL